MSQEPLKGHQGWMDLEPRKSNREGRTTPVSAELGIFASLIPILWRKKREEEREERG